MQPAKDTIRIILFLQCNMHCDYCCNEQDRFSSQFVHIKFSEIDFNNYQNVCLSGGEPFLYKDKLYTALGNIPPDKNIYIYTNGTLIKMLDIGKLSAFKNLKCINIGLHHINQLKNIIPIENYLPVRFMLRDINRESFLSKYPERLNSINTKTWKLNECDMPNEDWVLIDA